MNDTQTATEPTKAPTRADRTVRTDPPAPGDDFAAEAGRARPSFLAELWAFMADNKKWWLLPIVLVLVFFGVLLWLSTTAAAPFIYPLF